MAFREMRSPLSGSARLADPGYGYGYGYGYCFGWWARHWLREDPDGDGWFQLRNRNSGKCLEVFAFSQDSGGNVVQWGCWGGVKQRWNDQVANPPIIR